MGNIHSYGYGEFGHFSLECLDLKKENRRTSTWRDDDKFDIKKGNEEISNICLMTLKETNEVRSLICNKCNDLQNLLHHAIHDLNHISDELRKVQRKKRD